MLRSSPPKATFKAQKSLGFDSSNVNETSHIPLEVRDYGFVKVTNAGTPYIKKDSPIDSKLLMDRLKYTQGKMNSNIAFGLAMSSSDNGDDVSDELIMGQPKQEMTFEMKRKLFHMAEFTITKGKKISDMHHARNESNLPKHSTRESQLKALKDMEDFCHAMNIKISKGFGH
ncbi:uncharacterized protein LOC26527469 [Drosophila mojavensis]|uniref:Uncharacterized protein n=1 Tax=Drosophila mojavensis TaxID=7230 RepID=A0A0Q9WXU0_DROMO|nr:uncharacterized protein LOC26527469 [Drosophila mojavensis]KRG00847.1 uncharacterized protein Dmoj_GI25828 [Drosophila mojavensis]